MSTNTTRRNFIGMLGAAATVGGTTCLAMAGKPDFRDLEDNEYYALWYNSGDPNAVVKTGHDWRSILLWFYDHGYCGEVIMNADIVKKSFVPVRHMEPEYGEANKIDITQEWLWELYRRYRSDEIGDNFDK